jgi:hypothetical protein
VYPAAVALTWEAEVKRWRPDLQMTLLESGEPLRRPARREILGISYDSQPELRTDTTRVVDEPLRDVHLIGDEIQYVMHESAMRSRKFRRLRLQCGWCWGLSATPMPGDPEDYWGVIVSLGLAHMFEDRSSFVELCGGKARYIWDKKMNRGRGGLRQIGYKWGEISPEVKRRMAPVVLRRLADDVLDDLPETQEIDVPVRAPSDLVPFLTRVKEQWDSVSPGDLPPFELLSEAMAALARSKIPHAVELADTKASLESPLLVFSAHVDPILAVGELEGAGIITGMESLADRRRTVEKFQTGKLRILAMTIRCGGAGLNLQRAGGVLFVDRDYTPGQNAQALGRARRQGNTRSRVVCWRLISNHPLDVHLSAILDRKQRLISAAVG